MAVKLIFEDGETTPSSILLKDTLNGDNIFFSNGVSQLLNKAVEEREEGDIIYMFYDMSPNNSATVKGYNSLINTIKSDKKEYKNMYVIPIVCIEYHICQMFNKFDYFYTKQKVAIELIDKIVKTFDWDNLPNNIKTHSKIGNSLEKAYKHIIEQQQMLCLRNNFKYTEDGTTRITHSINGIFYEKDCNCERCFCKINCTENKSIKAEKLYSTLPILVVNTEEHKQLLSKLGVNIIKISNTDIKLERQEFYKMVCNNMKIPVPKISI